MCRFAPVRDPELPDGAEATHHTRVCTGEGDMPSCQLCPESLTYWRLTAPEPVADPWDGTGGGTSEIAEPSTAYEHAINSKTDGWWATGAPFFTTLPCVLCLKPTTMRSPKNKPCHKTCAEEYNAGKRVFFMPR